ncbi:molybdopterin-binding protein [Clostridium magnum]|uniref:Molybdopterin molybdenumtransferase n=1 Tax=Clostridium magnum DSM 2767 TaxID=1121326 RepID=A0A161X665_9CLOT|nr:molybdopterin-binding protein [Clostridium magnum]KZL89516.1 molybdopterin molybdenumtransferase [Clostridium magnum DSM 2767]SHH71072.1 molybdenum cofactor synthesis domain-containing protein [Clostridium magnum DSM 2767]
MKILPVEDAVGMILAHDMTEIVPGKSSGAAFKKGHVIKKEDIPRLLNMGKEHIYIMEFKAGDVHENEAAIRMAKAAAGQGIEFSGPSEGKVSLSSKYPGLLKVNFKALAEINSIDEAMFATLHTNQFINENTKIAGTRIIPLVIDEEKVKVVEEICKINYPIIEVKPLKKLKIGIVTTGNEVFYKRIEDKFGPVIEKKFKELGCSVIKQIFSKDDADMIAESIKTLIDEGADIITTTGGMSVDPDDVTPTGIRKSGANIISYGAPTLPGAMFLLSYIDNIPVLGLPGCVMYNDRTIFDLVVPRLVAGEIVTKQDIVKLGHGGLCTGCETCRYPNCGFGKGGLY